MPAPHFTLKHPYGTPDQVRYAEAFEDRSVIDHDGRSCVVISRKTEQGQTQPSYGGSQAAAMTTTFELVYIESEHATPAPPLESEHAAFVAYLLVGSEMLTQYGSQSEDDRAEELRDEMDFLWWNELSGSNLENASQLLALFQDASQRFEIPNTIKPEVHEPLLKERAGLWLDVGRAYWEAFSKEHGSSAVVWADDIDGALVIYTRGEYSDQLRAAFPSPSGPVHTFTETPHPDRVIAWLAQPDINPTPWFINQDESERWVEDDEACMISHDPGVTQDTPAFVAAVNAACARVKSGDLAPPAPESARYPRARVLTVMCSLEGFIEDAATAEPETLSGWLNTLRVAHEELAFTKGVLPRYFKVTPLDNESGSGVSLRMLRGWAANVAGITPEITKDMTADEILGAVAETIPIKSGDDAIVGPGPFKAWTAARSQTLAGQWIATKYPQGVVHPPCPVFVAPARQAEEDEREDSTVDRPSILDVTVADSLCALVAVEDGKSTICEWLSAGSTGPAAHTLQDPRGLVTFSTVAPGLADGRYTMTWIADDQHARVVVARAHAPLLSARERLSLQKPPADALDIPAQIAEEMFSAHAAHEREQFIHRWRGKLQDALTGGSETLETAGEVHDFLTSLGSQPEDTASFFRDTPWLPHSSVEIDHAKSDEKTLRALGLYARPTDPLDPHDGDDWPAPVSDHYAQAIRYLVALVNHRRYPVAIPWRAELNENGSFKILGCRGNGFDCLDENAPEIVATINRALTGFADPSHVTKEEVAAYIAASRKRSVEPRMGEGLASKVNPWEGVQAWLILHTTLVKLDEEGT